MYVLVWHAKEPLLLNGHECRVKICSHSPVMVTTPYELIIHEWDQKTPKNKQTNETPPKTIQSINLHLIQNSKVTIFNNFNLVIRIETKHQSGNIQNFDLIKYV